MFTPAFKFCDQFVIGDGDLRMVFVCEAVRQFEYLVHQ